MTKRSSFWLDSGVSSSKIPIFDLDGTLVDSDDALIGPFLSLGVAREDLSFGHAVGPECERLGISLSAYVDAYDTDAAQPFSGAQELVEQLGRWAVCSNKHQTSGNAELKRLGWRPEVAMFADAFGGKSKRLGPVLEALGVSAADVVFVGDTAHDEKCALEVGCEFYWAGWNPRTAEAEISGNILHDPQQILGFL